MKRWMRLLVNITLVLLLFAGAFWLGRVFERYIPFAPIQQAHPSTVQEQVTDTLPVQKTARLYGLGLVWEKGKYNYPFFDRQSELNWDAAYQIAIQEVLDAQDDLAYYHALQRFAARLKDGHSRVQLPPALQEQIDRPPLRLDVYREELYLSRWLEPKPETEKYRGARLLKVDGEAAAQRISELQARLSASTPQDLWARTADELLAGPVGSETTLEVQLASGEIEELQVRRNTREIAAGRGLSNQLILTRDLGDGLRYVRIFSFADKAVAGQFNQAFPNFKGIKGLVIDVRDNGGGNSAYGDQIFGRLIRWPVRNVNWQSRERVAFMDAGKMGELWFYGPPGILSPGSLTNQYTGPVVVLTNARTYSAAENFTALFQMNKRGQIIGEATGGSTGQPIFFKLPGGGTGAIVTKWDMYPDGTQFVGMGIRPEIEVTPTPADWAAGRDPVLEKATMVLQEQ